MKQELGFGVKLQIFYFFFFLSFLLWKQSKLQVLA